MENCIKQRHLLIDSLKAEKEQENAQQNQKAITTIQQNLKLTVVNPEEFLTIIGNSDSKDPLEMQSENSYRLAKNEFVEKEKLACRVEKKLELLKLRYGHGKISGIISKNIVKYCSESAKKGLGEIQ